SRRGNLGSAPRRRGGSALSVRHGGLFRPRQAHEQSRQTVSPAFLLLPSAPSFEFSCFVRSASDSIAATRVLFQDGDFISFRSTNRAVWDLAHRIRSHRFVILGPIVLSFRVECVLSDQGIPRSSLGVLLLDEVSFVRQKS
ncbi:Gamma-soluble NSF attachment protein, partial [Zea mays]